MNIWQSWNASSFRPRLQNSGNDWVVRVNQKKNSRKEEQPVVAKNKDVELVPTEWPI